MATKRLLLVAVLVTLAASCADDAFLRTLRFACDDEAPCAPGWECGPEGLCVRQGTVPELCNGLDDDHDGATDEDLAAAVCELAKGECAGALHAEAQCQGEDGWAPCTADEYRAASASYEAAETTCDGLDNDCDGVTDNLSARPTENQVGVCEGAVMVCDGDAQDLRESYRDDPDHESAETRCDGLDNDCDGETDPMLATAPRHCGRCGFECPAGYDGCDGGVCRDAAAPVCGYLLGPADVTTAAEMCLLPAGDYSVGDPGATAAIEATLLVDRFEVTNLRYEVFLDDRADPTGLVPACTPANAARDWAAARPRYDEGLADHPVACVTRAQAEAFCAWAGKRLPSVEEWEAAARGDDGRAYPWGDDPPTARANCLDEECHDVYARDTCAAVEGSRERCADTCPVFDVDGAVTLADGASPYGPLHLAGNVAEWTRDDRDGDRGATKGGSWYGAPDDLVAAREEVVPTDYAKVTTGFRCVANWPDL